MNHQISGERGKSKSVTVHYTFTEAQERVYSYVGLQGLTHTRIYMQCMLLKRFRDVCVLKSALGFATFLSLGHTTVTFRYFHFS